MFDKLYVVYREGNPRGSRWDFYVQIGLFSIFFMTLVPVFLLCLFSALYLAKDALSDTLVSIASAFTPSCTCTVTECPTTA